MNHYASYLFDVDLGLHDIRALHSADAIELHVFSARASCANPKLPSSPLVIPAHGVVIEPQPSSSGPGHRLSTTAVCGKP